jgi:hypothetical protein
MDRVIARNSASLSEDATVEMMNKETGLPGGTSVDSGLMRAIHQELSVSEAGGARPRQIIACKLKAGLVENGCACGFGRHVDLGPRIWYCKTAHQRYNSAIQDVKEILVR